MFSNQKSKYKNYFDVMLNSRVLRFAKIRFSRIIVNLQYVYLAIDIVCIDWRRCKR